MKRLLAMSAILLAVGCGPTETPIQDVTEKEPLGGECQDATNCGNCVFYAGCRAPGLKQFNLTTWAQKKGAINSENGSPGCVAMIDTDSEYGHVAYVTKVSHDPHHVWIDEGNWGGPVCGSRDGSKAELRIAGYWCP